MLAASLPEHPAAGDVVLWLDALSAMPGRRPGSTMEEATVELHRSNLRRAFEWGNAAGMCWGNPAALVAKRRFKRTPKAIPNIARAFPRLAATASDPREAAFLATLRFAGLRVGEALGLEPEHVRLNTRPRVLRIVQQRDAEGWATKPPKADSRRELPIREELAPYLARVAKRPSVVRVGRGGTRSAEVSFLFPYRVAQLEAMRARLAGVDDDHFGPGDAWHVFRHSFAVEGRNRGASVEELSGWLGHKSVGTTEKYLSLLTGKRVELGAFA